MAETFKQLAQLSEIEALRYSVDSCRHSAEIICQDAPAAVEAAGIEALIVDQLEPVGETIAEFLNLPFVCVSCGQAIQRRADAPPFFMPWNYENTLWARLRNQVAYTILDRSCQPILQVINQYRQQWKLPRSVQNTKQDVFRCIAEACKRLNVQLVIAHGGGMSPDAVQALPGSPLVVDYAPQLEVIAKASLTITHGGLNTVLDSLSHGVPLVAMPITFEQPGNAARIRWTGTGEMIAISRLSVSKLQTAIQQVLAEESYRYNARRIQEAIAQAGGVRRAADIIEQVITPQSPTLSLSTSRTRA
ncbi:hypothetical protein H6F98_07590 [Microcoleus sp. FACHB-SPT15]|nr:hypothetical protein [Microcoleus sp. FACHB-SPT15]